MRSLAPLDLSLCLSDGPSASARAVSCPDWRRPHPLLLAFRKTTNLQTAVNEVYSGQSELYRQTLLAKLAAGVRAFHKHAHEISPGGTMNPAPFPGGGIEPGRTLKPAPTGQNPVPITVLQSGQPMPSHMSSVGTGR